MDLSQKQASTTETAFSQQAFNLISREQLKHLAWDEGKTDAQIAELFHVTTNQVNNKRHQMNLVQGQMSATELSDIVCLAESIKSLPLEAIGEIKRIVQQYS